MRPAVTPGGRIWRRGTGSGGIVEIISAGGDWNDEPSAQPDSSVINGRITKGLRREANIMRIKIAASHR
ncbi:hypothetical protein AA106556_0385 [Neokomagataea tanensis NBRC 106556]|uniref:Uncharacterized protein n=1 Tax=Neokomagataea tanensis NBRC 106556 TaxID=1223519 RepID=A0ABQ0QGW8_9PROT|nr:hypothetical protein AA106556_0385 [Neokomagataea tanensis NBRC 106556]